MKNKLVFRILGALASALIIASVFVPFVSVTGYSPSLWETYELTNALYLPIMIIVFGAIGVIFFALNVKTEFAYMSAGAVTFFGVMQTIDILEQGVFNTLSIGYYFLIVGALLTGVMAFLTNLKTKKKEEIVADIQQNETSMLDQIDKLYNDQTTIQSEISPIQPVNNIVEPIPLQPIETITPVQPIDVVNPIQPVVEPMPIVEPVVQQPEVIQSIPAVDQTPVQQPVVNPVIQEFAQPIVNPVVQEFTNPTVQVQPVVESVMTPQPEVIQGLPVVEPVTVQEQPINPVIQEFGQPTVNPVVQEFTNPVQSIETKQTNELDIFGQPINK